MKEKLNVLLASLVIVMPFSGMADVQPAALFSDGMVIQREANAPVWGTADAGEKVNVTASWGETANTTADASGKWMVKLKTPKAGGPYTLTIQGNNTLEIKDVLSGEVWFCSGQSNMAFQLKSLAKTNNHRTEKQYKAAAAYVKQEMETARDERLRQFTVTGNTSPLEPLERLSGQWMSSSPQTNPDFSGTAYFFGRELREELDVPVGLILCAWGATRVEPWIPAEAYQQDEEMAAYYQGNMMLEEEEKAEREATRRGWRPTVPSTIFNGMVNPVIPYAIKGAIWYQGEANSIHHPHSYERNLRALISSWRAHWGQGDPTTGAGQAFPFYFAQLANYAKPAPGTVGFEGWPTVCDQQRRTLGLKNTGMAVLHDIGEARDGHPHNKMDVGKRLSLWALKNDYRQKVSVCSGPLYKSHKIEGDQVIITFDSAGSGLMSGEKPVMDPARETGEPLGQFQICGADRQWKSARAEITGKDTLTVSHPEVREPVIVRYAWAPNPEGANLYNKEGLPASIFTTEAEIPVAVGTALVTPQHAQSEESTVRVMSYNACRGGTYQGQPLSQSAKMIQEAQADIVGLQEIGDNVPKLAKLLGWNHCGPFLTRYEIVEEMPDSTKRPAHGMKVKLPSGQEAYVFNLHLPHGPFQPYQLLGLTAGYRVYPKIDTEAEAITGAKNTRARFLTRLFKRIAALSDKEAPVFVVGDFNEPSHLDWTEAAAKAGRHPMKVEFPNSLTMAQAGYVDAYRTVYPDEMAKPGFTWTPLKKADDPEIHHDRIDYVYSKGKGLKVTDAKVVGENQENADIVVAPYPSDHRAVVATFTLANQAISEKANTSEAREIRYTSSADQSEQPALFYAPASKAPVPLIVALHTWSGTYKQKSHKAIEQWCIQHGWAYLHPDFRGPNNRPEATGSALVVADIVSAVEYAKQATNIDDSSIYLVGTSGGGYTALVMAGHHPKKWAGVSAWVPISDLAAWHAQGKHVEALVASCGGAPGDTPAVDAEYAKRSPLTYLKNARGTTLHLSAGIRDSIVPVSHSLLAFNEVAAADDRIPEEDIRFFVEKRKVPNTLKADRSDPTYGKKQPLFRRESGHATVTIFDGGHELVAPAAIAWIQQVHDEKKEKNKSNARDAQ